MSRVDAWLSFGGEFDYVLRSSWLSKGTRKPKKASWTHGPCLGGGGGILVRVGRIAYVREDFS